RVRRPGVQGDDLRVHVVAHVRRAQARGLGFGAGCVGADAHAVHGLAVHPRGLAKSRELRGAQRGHAGLRGLGGGEAAPAHRVVATGGGGREHARVVFGCRRRGTGGRGGQFGRVLGIRGGGSGRFGGQFRGIVVRRRRAGGGQRAGRRIAFRGRRHAERAALGRGLGTDQR